MNWVLEHLQLIIGAAAAIAYVLNQRRAASKADSESPPPKHAGDIEQEARTRRIQEEMRRKRAERSGESSGTPSSPRELIPPLVRPTNVPPIDPFGGPMRKVVRKLEEAARQFEQPDDSARERERAAEVARQARLAEQLRELEEARAVQQRRAAAIMAQNARRVEAPSRDAIAGRDLKGMLKDPREVRRAFVLREILGPPVSSRR